MEHPDLPGWSITTQSFDYGARTGVCIERLADDVRHRHAVLIPGNLSDEAAIETALPSLQKWAAE